MSKNVYSASIYFIVFSWFAMHFGGGFASGRQVVEFYVMWGWTALFMPLLSIAIIGLASYFIFKRAVEKRLFDYRSWANDFYKNNFLATIFDVIIILLLLIVCAVVVATGGQVLYDLLRIPVFLGALLLSAAIWVVTILGAETVRKVSSYIALFLALTLVIIFGTHFLTNYQAIGVHVVERSMGGTYFDALWNMILYFGLQMITASVIIALLEPIKTIEEVKKVAVLGVIINAFVITVVSWGMLVDYPDIIPQPVPTLFVTESGIGGDYGFALVSLIILFGAFTTGVVSVYGNSRRFVEWWAKRTASEPNRPKFIVISFIWIVLMYFIALFGIVDLVAIGYRYLAFINVFYIGLPVIVVGVYQSIKKDKEKKNSSKLCQDERV